MAKSLSIDEIRVDRPKMVNGAVPPDNFDGLDPWDDTDFWDY